ncbi:hypothetical protein HanLR1_Chr03g0110131 [Helianthus annuus]|nr:hypothetical protein HanHA89_Chr03g0116601 [Helianthus annuus]KAJ0769202.1 hypothetical protein HanLR1_Chr03g0110131 [Helianthus annuus]
MVRWGFHFQISPPPLMKMSAVCGPHLQEKRWTKSMQSARRRGFVFFNSTKRSALFNTHNRHNSSLSLCLHQPPPPQPPPPPNTHHRPPSQPAPSTVAASATPYLHLPPPQYSLSLCLHLPPPPPPHSSPSTTTTRRIRINK